MSPIPTFRGWPLPFRVAGILALLVGCQAAPLNDPLGWDGRGMALPVDTGSGGGNGLSSGIGNSGTGGAPAGSAGGSVGGSVGTSGSGGGNASGTGGASMVGAGGSGVAPADSGVMLPPPPDGAQVAGTCHLVVTVTTHSSGRGGYDPRNIGAIWIETGAQKFVKSLNVWAARRMNHLTRWNASTSAAGLSRNRVDAVTAATLSNYGTQTGSWNCTDTNKQRVASGAYQVCFELNDTNDDSESDCAPIIIGKSPTTVKVPDALPCFTGQTLTFTP